MKEITNAYYVLKHEDSKKDINIYKEFSDFFVPKDSVPEGTIVIEPLIKGEYIPFEFEYKDINYHGLYMFDYKNMPQTEREGYYFEIKIIYEDKKAGMAAFSELLERLMKMISSRCYLVSLDDSITKYYTQLGYKYTSEYEHKLRKLILVILFPEHGERWPQQLGEYSDNTMSKQGIEKGLQELDLSHLEDILFAKKIEVTFENYEELFKFDDLDALKEKELKNLIKKYAPKSFWETYISEHLTGVDIVEKTINIRNVTVK